MSLLQACPFLQPRRIAPFTSLNVAGHRIVEHVRTMLNPRVLQRFREPRRSAASSTAAGSSYDLLQSSLFDVHLRPFQIENIARSKTGIDRKQDHVAQVRRRGKKAAFLLILLRVSKWRLSSGRNLTSRTGFVP